MNFNPDDYWFMLDQNESGEQLEKNQNPQQAASLAHRNNQNEPEE